MQQPPACPGPTDTGWQQRDCPPTAYAWGLGLRTSLGASPAAQAEQGGWGRRLGVCSTAGPCRLLRLTHVGRTYGEGPLAGSCGQADLDQEEVLDSGSREVRCAY